jgi:hypothetical protein
MFCIAKSTFCGVSTLRFLPLTIPAACDVDGAAPPPPFEASVERKVQSFPQGPDYISSAFTLAGLVSSERSAFVAELQPPWFSTPSAPVRFCI